MFYPDVYDQDKSKSIVTDDGLYDMERFSEHEEEVINQAMRAATTKYPAELRSIGLANEAQVVVYKPRYILWEVVIQKYMSSAKPIDKLAVAIAYSEKGAMFRGKAISCFEDAIGQLGNPVDTKVASFSELTVYTKFSKLYEQEREFEKAILCISSAARSCPPETKAYYDNEILRLKEKAAKPTKKRNVKQKPEDIEFEEKVATAAFRFVF